MVSVMMLSEVMSFALNDLGELSTKGNSNPWFYNNYDIEQNFKNELHWCLVI